LIDDVASRLKNNQKYDKLFSIKWRVVWQIKSLLKF
jgi:hypothetical protein